MIGGEIQDKPCGLLYASSSQLAYKTAVVLNAYGLVHIAKELTIKQTMYSYFLLAETF